MNIQKNSHHRIFLFFIVGILLLSSCSSPKLIGEPFRTLGENAIAVADEFLAGQCTASDAASRLEPIYDRIQSAYDEYETSIDPNDSTQYVRKANLFSMALSVFNMRVELMASAQDDAQIRAIRNEIKSILDATE